MPAPTGMSPAPSQCCTCGSGRAREEAGTAMHELLPYSETISHPVPPLQPLPFKRRFNFKEDHNAISRIPPTASWALLRARQALPADHHHAPTKTTVP
ncbi:hypothetical protein CXG50_01795 [Pseudomonas plecoglossicida]|nr:hypothetical protein CSW00_02750 [Pseudomonas sp. MR 02]PLP93374.1 hypothetical protein CX682_03780 [Pseudomonas sp. FFUP_PS_41]PLV00652.1 hypothetical protein CXG52_03320 [Pseudomonas plecoglossicida]PLV12165.1 hypothetical protein CXG50_01795 [Pseudomonas plecoglossicida]